MNIERKLKQIEIVDPAGMSTDDLILLDKNALIALINNVAAQSASAERRGVKNKYLLG